MATLKYRINKGAWQTVQLSPENCTGFTLTGNEDYPVPEGYEGTYVASGITHNQREYYEYMELFVWYCSSANKTLYSLMPYGFSELHTTDSIDPWSYEEGEYFYVTEYGSNKNMTYNLTTPQRLTLNLNAGDEVEVVCAARSLFDTSVAESTGDVKFANVIRYDTSCPHEVFGNVNSASYGEGFDGSGATFDGFDEVEYYNDSTYQWYGIGTNSVSTNPGLFSEQWYLTSTKNLLVHNLGDGSFGARRMFYNCYNMVEAPEFLPDTVLPASSITNFPSTGTEIGCYSEMFMECQNLKTAPKLPATEVRYRSYYGMFKNCSSIEKAPDLPATTIGAESYSCMFYSCNNLVKIPKILPAMTLETACYSYMFSGTKIKTAPVLPATSMTWACYHNMFSSCSDLVSPPELPAMSAAQYCYSYMFAYCSSLTTPPALPATKLSDYCYEWMFYSCDALKTAPALPSLSASYHCYDSMFSYCYSLTNAPELPATTLSEDCYESMFSFCTGLTGVPSTLPATALSRYCYYGMFKGCTGLTTTPVLPARTVNDYSYEEMFYGCSSLNYVKAMFTNTPGDTWATRYRTRNWLYGVSATGTFVKNASATWSLSGPSGIPNGWTVETATE